MSVATDNLNDSSDDNSYEYEYETVSGDKISMLNNFNESSDTENESNVVINNGPSTRERLEKLREERALKNSICDDLYNPESSLD
jgi:hypothetical protein